MTVTVMKTKSCTAPPVTITPTKCLCTKTIKEILRTTVVIDNKIPDVAKDYNPSKKKSLQPSVYIGNRLPQADNNSDMKKLKRKCIPSNSAQMTPSRAGMTFCYFFRFRSIPTLNNTYSKENQGNSIRNL